MYAFCYKSCLGIIVFFLFFLLFSPKAHANPYGTMCYLSQYNGPEPLEQYCGAWNSSGFTDTGNDPKLEVLRKLNIFAGYSADDCTAKGLTYPCFVPNDRITRWQVAAAITRYHIFVKRDWYSWDPANDPVPNEPDCDCDPPDVVNFDGSYLADVDYYTDPGGWETHTALLHNWIRGGTCDSFYDPVVPTVNWSDAGSENGYTSGIMVRDQYHGRNIRDKDLCFGPQSDWAFGFHGVDRADAAFMWYTVHPINTPIMNHRFYYCNYYSPVQSGPGSCEEEWPQGSWYNFAGGGDSPYFMTRKAFADLMYDYYVEVDNNNYCANAQTGSLSVSGTDTGTDGQGAYCVIHAGQSQCSGSLLWNSNYTMNNTCNYAKVTTGSNVEMARGASGTVASETTTGPSDIKSYKLMYNFDMTFPFISGKSFISQLSQLSFSGRNTTGSITIPAPGNPCQIPSGSTSCSQSIHWDTTYISNGATVTLRDTTNNVAIPAGTTSGTTSYSISGPTTFVLYENGIQIATRTITPVVLRTISGTVRVDYNDNAAVDAAPSGPPDGVFTEGTLVTLILNSNGTTVATATTDSSGAYSFQNLQPVGYRVSIPSTIPSTNYPEGLHPSAVQTNPVNVVVFTADATVNFYISPYYRLSGGVFVDTNKNGHKDGGENYYTGGGLTFGNTGGGSLSINQAAGTFLITGLASNQTPNPAFTVSYTSTIPNGYIITYPSVGSGSPSYSINIGKTCSSPAISPTAGDGTCDANGNITNLNFGISNSTPWLQGIGMDMRFDGGLNNPIPTLTSTCGGVGTQMYTMMPSSAADTTTQGGVFIGNSSAANAFGVRSTPSSKGWVIDQPYPETFTPITGKTIRTSYSYLLAAVNRSGISKTAITSIGTCTDPSISCSLPNATSGVYTHDGDVILSALTIPANRNVILLIKGNLSITGAITVPNTSTLQIAVGDNVGGTAGNITIASSIGAAGSCPAPAGQIQGFFTADKNIVINGTNDCTVGKDTMLTIEGALVINASLSGGSFTFNRDLCEDDTRYPAVVIKERPDFILHLPDVSKLQNYVFQETAP